MGTGVEGVGRHVGDRGVQQPAVHLRGGLAHQAGADDRPVRLVQVAAEGARRRPLLRRLLHDVRLAVAQHERGAAGPLRRQRAEPEADLDDVAVHRDPLGLRVGRQRRVRDARAQLQAEGRHPVADGEHGVERRLVGGGVEHAASRRRPAGRVRVDAVDALRLEVEREPVAVPHLGVGEVPQVHGRDGGRGLVDVRREHPQADAREGHRVRPDPAGEVRDPGAARVAEPAGVVRRDAEPGGLLEPGRGEEHAVRERPELPGGLRAQAGLRQRGGHQGRVDPLVAHPLREREGAALVVRRQRRQQGPARGAEQLGDAVAIHVAILARRRPPGGPGGSLALALTEC